MLKRFKRKSKLQRLSSLLLQYDSYKGKQVGKSTFYCCPHLLSNLIIHDGFHNNTNWEVKHPTMPYVSPIPCPIEPGRLISIKAHIPHKAKRFAVNFACGSDIADDIALYFAPVIADGVHITQNTRVDKIWGKEEKVEGQNENPFLRDMTFFLDIFVLEKEFCFSVNGRYLMSYPHRVPVTLIDTMFVLGDVELICIKYRRCGFYPVLCPVNWKTYDAFIVKDSDKGEGDDVENIENNIVVPFVGKLPTLFNVGDELVISGRVRLMRSNKFEIKLQQGQQYYPYPIIPLRITALFAEPKIANREVGFNSQIIGQWEAEETTTEPVFRMGTKFVLAIKSEPEHYVITVDNKHVTNYKHRTMNNGIVNTIMIKGEVAISNITIK